MSFPKNIEFYNFTYKSLPNHCGGSELHRHLEIWKLFRCPIYSFHCLSNCGRYVAGKRVRAAVPRWHRRWRGPGNCGCGKESPSPPLCIVYQINSKSLHLSCWAILTVRNLSSWILLVIETAGLRSQGRLERHVHGSASLFLMHCFNFLWPEQRHLTSYPYRCTLADFQIEKKIGRGQFSEVYKATCLLDRKPVALKKVQVSFEGQSLTI